MKSPLEGKLTSWLTRNWLKKKVSLTFPISYGVRAYIKFELFKNILSGFL